MKDNKNYERDGKLYKITDKELLVQIHSLVNEETNNILAGITIAKKFYGDKYPNMKYSDWSNLIKGTKEIKAKDNSTTNFRELFKNPELRIELGQYPDRLIAEKYHCSINDVCRIRSKLGIKSYGQKEVSKLPQDIKDIIEDYNKLGSLQKVADKYGCTRQAVSLRLKKGNTVIKKKEITEESMITFFDSLVFKENKKFAITIFDFLFENNLITKELLSLLCNKEEIDKTLGIAVPFPILLKISKETDLKLQVFISGQNRYYVDHIYEFSGNLYAVTSQWYGPKTTKPDIKTPFINFIKQKMLESGMLSITVQKSPEENE